MKTKSKNITQKLLCLLLTVLMVVTALPFTVFATEKDSVYISISFDGEFVNDKNNKPIAYAEVPMSALENISLDEYGLSDFYYDGDGDGKYDVTALHLYIYTHEEFFGLDWSDVVVSGSPSSIFFQEGLFGFPDCNLNYYLNGIYPELSPGWGATADNLSLKSGDFYDIAGYTSWEFWMDSAAGFNYFADANGEITHSYEVDADKELPISLVRSGGGFGGELALSEVADCSVSYGKTLGEAMGTVTTDSSGVATIPALQSGTWYLWCNGGYGAEYSSAIVSAPAFASITVKGKDTPVRQPQDVSAVLNATLAQLADTVTEPAFGTNAGEWTVLCLARGEYFNTGDEYFEAYYDRIVEYVNSKAESINLNGALHKSKSTDNSRVILALSSIGKDATSVGNWDLTANYSDFSWVKKQGINGVIYTLIALDTNNYMTEDETIRQQCVDYLLEKQLVDGGWAMSGSSMNTDITGMALQALYPYRDKADVANAAQKAFDRLSREQLSTGGFLYGTGETSESAAQIIVACTTWGINPDTDIRFIKDGNSAVDNLLSYYVEDDAMFKHAQSGDSNAMATDQACYALIAYKRLVTGKTSLYNMYDVTFEEVVTPVKGDLTATLSVPAEIEDTKGATFNGVISINQWDNNGAYKLIDYVMNIPSGVAVEDVVANNCLNGGEINWYVENSTRKLRVVYFDANNNNDITVTGTSFPSDLFTVKFRVDTAKAGDVLDIALTGMSVKLNSDSTNPDSIIVVKTDKASGSVNVVQGVSFNAICLYQGDDVDLIPSSKKAVALSVTSVDEQTKVTYNDGTNAVDFKYSPEISSKTGVSSYVAIVPALIDMQNFADKSNFEIEDTKAEALQFGDANFDGIVNAQDALSAVDAWLRKSDAPNDNEILALNVNSDSRVNTFDALGIVESFVNGTDYQVVTKAAALAN